MNGDFGFLNDASLVATAEVHDQFEQAGGKGFEQFMAKGDADMGVVMKSLGLAK